MPKMRAVQVSHPNGPFELVERDLPEPGAQDGHLVQKRNQLGLSMCARSPERCLEQASGTFIRDPRTAGSRLNRVPGCKFQCNACFHPTQPKRLHKLSLGRQKAFLQINEYKKRGRSLLGTGSRLWEGNSMDDYRRTGLSANGQCLRRRLMQCQSLD